MLHLSQQRWPSPACGCPSNRNANAIATIILFMSESALPFLPDLLSLQSNPRSTSCAHLFCKRRQPRNRTQTMTDPAKVHASALVIDTHADTPQRFVDEHWNFTDPLNGGMLNYDSAKEGNLDAQFFAIWVDPSQYPANASARRTLALIDATLEQVHRAPTNSSSAPQPMTSSPHTNKANSPSSWESKAATPSKTPSPSSATIYRLGVRYMTLTWSNTNDWADSSGDIDDPTVPHHNGLTPFGKDVIREMNRLGMMVDISHASDKTFWDVLATTRAPIIASHSSARALTNAGRNLTDEMLHAVKKNNGVVMVNFFPAFIDDHWRQAWAAQKPERQQSTRRHRSRLQIQRPSRPLPRLQQNRSRVRRTHRTGTVRFPHRPLRSHHPRRRHRSHRHRHRLRRHPRLCPTTSTPPPISPKSPPPSWPGVTPPKT